MDFDAYDYLEKSVDEAEIGKRDGAEKTHRSFRRRNDKDDEDDIADSRSKRSRLELHNGERRSDNDRDKSSRSERRDRDRHKSNRDAERERGRDRDRGDRERDKEREKRREKDKEMERDKEKDRVKERDRERERDKDRDKEAERERERDRDKHREKERDTLRERERDKETEKDKDREKERDREKEKEKEKEKERERERVREREKEKERDNDKEKDKSQISRRHPTHPDKDADREIPRGRSRDREARERDRELEMRESRKYKEKKEVAEPEADPERDQRTVFAYQMPLKATEKDVYEFFSQAGKVRDVRLIMDRNSRRSKGVGYVEFYDAMSVPMAIALSGHRFLDHTVMVKPSEAEKNLVQSTSGVSGGLTGTYGAVARKLYVGNLHFNMTEDQLRQVFEPFGAVELVQLPIDTESKQCKGFGFVQFAQLEHAKAAQSLNGKLDIAGRIIKVSAVTDHPGFQNAGANAADFDDDDGGGLSLNAQSRAMLMQRLDRTGVATSIAGSLGVPLLNGSVPNQQTSGLHMNVQAAIPAPVPALVTPSPAAEPIGSPSMCLLLKNMFDPATEMDPEFDLDIREEVQEECSNFGAVKHIYVDKNSAGHVYLRFESVAEAASAQRAMHMRWFARRLILAVFMQPREYEAKFSNGA